MSKDFKIASRPLVFAFKNKKIRGIENEDGLRILFYSEFEIIK